MSLGGKSSLPTHMMQRCALETSVRTGLASYRGPRTPNIFVHAETLPRCGFTELGPAQDRGARPNGLTAAELEPDNAPGLSSLGGKISLITVAFAPQPAKATQTVSLTAK
jgi:hypothetical protein